MKTEKIRFSELREFEGSDGFGIIVTGAGGKVSEWVNGIEGVLKEAGIVDKEVPTFIRSAIVDGNVLGNKGRRDLLLVFNPEAKVNVGKLAVWRIQFGDVSWVDDFMVNYAKDYALL